MIYLGADHAGFALKEQIKEYFKELGREYEDLGAFELNPEDDYPDFALAVAEKVAGTNGRPARNALRSNTGRGILICGSGAGMCMAANKVDGVRAVLCENERDAKLSREHNDANILCLDGGEIGLDDAKKITKTWLETEFTGEERHQRRLDKIKRAEKNN